MSNSRQNDDKNEVQVVAEQGSDIFRLLNLNRVLLLCGVFRGEGSGNEDNFLNSGCCAGPRFQAGKVPPLSPASSPSLRSGGTARQTAEKSNVFLGCVASSAVSGMPDLGCPPLVERERRAASGVGGDATDGRADGASGIPLLASLTGATPICRCLFRAGLWWRTLFSSCSLWCRRCCLRLGRVRA